MQGRVNQILPFDLVSPYLSLRSRNLLRCKTPESARLQALLARLDASRDLGRLCASTHASIKQHYHIIKLANLPSHHDTCENDTQGHLLPGKTIQKKFMRK